MARVVPKIIATQTTIAGRKLALLATTDHAPMPISITMALGLETITVIKGHARREINVARLVATVSLMRRSLAIDWVSHLHLDLLQIQPAPLHHET